MEKNQFKKFFESYSKNVDFAKKLAFWRLSDDLVMSVIKRHIPQPLTENSVILDAGGGTGRWVAELSNVYKSKFVLYDRSEDMLDVAQKNIVIANIQSRTRLIQGDLCNMEEVDDESIDYVVSIYSPISFIHKKEEAIGELFRVLKPGGKIIIMGHGYYNALASKINNYLATAEELGRMEAESIVKWGAHVPELNIFSQESMHELLIKQGFEIVQTHGIPVFVQPGPEDWDPENKQHSKITNALEKEDFYEQVFKLEMKYNGIPEIANRGMNIFTVASKPNS